MYALKTIISPNKEFKKFQLTPTLPEILKRKTKKGQLLTMHIKIGKIIVVSKFVARFIFIII